jgi:hypothetical protein
MQTPYVAQNDFGQEFLRLRNSLRAVVRHLDLMVVKSEDVAQASIAVANS